MGSLWWVRNTYWTFGEDDSVKEELIDKLEELDKRMTNCRDDLAIVRTYDNNNAILKSTQVQEEQKLRTGAHSSDILVLEMPMALKLKSWTIRLEWGWNQACDLSFWRATCIRSSEIWNGVHRLVRSPFDSLNVVIPPLHLLRSCPN